MKQSDKLESKNCVSSLAVVQLFAYTSHYLRPDIHDVRVCVCVSVRACVGGIQ